MAVTREDLSAAVQRRKPDITHAKARLIVDAVIDEISRALLETGTVRLRGLGVFTVRTKRARPGRNPRSGERTEVSARQSLNFKPSPKLVEAVNARKEE